MAISRKTFTASIRQRILDNLPAVLDADTQVQWPNQPFDRLNDKPYIQVQIVFSERDRIDLGNKFFANDGQLLIMVRNPKDSHTNDHEDLVDEISNIFDEFTTSITRFDESVVKTVGIDKATEFFRSDVINDFTIFE